MYLMWGLLGALAAALAVVTLSSGSRYLAAVLLLVAIHLTCICHKRMGG